MSEDEEEYPMQIRLWETSRWLSIEEGGKRFFIVPEDEAEFLVVQARQSISAVKAREDIKKSAD